MGTIVLQASTVFMFGYILEVEVAGSFEMLVHIYQTT
jgi:hypothetical protein